MSVKAIFAQLNCSNLGASVIWFSRLFHRDPDARPMSGLAEWHQGDCAGFQLFENAQHAGHGTLTLVVDDIEEEHRRLVEAGLKPGEIEPGKNTLVRLNDPDGNLVVLTQPGGA
jgi:hypothetical protein